MCLCDDTALRKWEDKQGGVKVEKKVGVRAKILRVRVVAFDHAALVPSSDGLLARRAAAQEHFHVHDVVLLRARLGVVVSALHENQVSRAQVFFRHLSS